MRSQSRTAKVDSASGQIFDYYYFDAEREEAEKEINISSRASEHKEASYLPYIQKSRRKKDKAEQVGWWLGRVKEVCEDYFIASLEDRHGRRSVAEFSKKEITPSDLNLLAPNVIFSYTVTQMDRRSGREYVSKISLSGQAIWTKRDVENAEKALEELFPENVLNF